MTDEIKRLEEIKKALSILGWTGGKLDDLETLLKNHYLTCNGCDLPLSDIQYFISRERIRGKEL
jgi:hypothetical protein